jgi:hypothetical protein
MVRQGFGVTVIPSPTNPMCYDLWATSMGWEAGKVAVTREIHIGTMLGPGSEFFPHDFAEWVDAMMEGMKEQIFAYLKVEGTSLVSAEAAYRAKLAEAASSDA